MSELAKYNNKNGIAPKSINDSVCEEFLGANFPRIDKRTKIAFLQLSRAFNLNPFKREIYLVGYQGKNGDNYNIIVGYEVYISRAMASGMLDGWQIESSIQKTVQLDANTGEFREINDLVATCTIWRKDFKNPFKKSASFSEYAQKTFDRNTKKWRINAMWREKPKTMLEKVATAQAFRLGFPAELGGIGYQAEELGHDSTAQHSPVIDSRVPVYQAVDYEIPLEQVNEILDNLEDSSDIDYLNAQLIAYFEHKNPEIKQAIWANAKRNAYYYDESAKKFLLESPIMPKEVLNNDDGNLTEKLDAIRIRLNEAKTEADFSEICEKIVAEFGDDNQKWPDGLATIINNATERLRAQSQAQNNDNELIY